MKTVILSTLLFSTMAFANRESGGKVGASAVYVEFTSFCTGIDSNAVAKYDRLLK